MKTRVFNLKRVCHLIIEEVDIVLKKFEPQLKSLMTSLQTMLKNRHVPYGIQVIATSTAWTVELEKFISKLDSLPMICIGDYLEAALYGRVDIQIQFVVLAAKKSFLSGKLK